MSVDQANIRMLRAEAEALVAEADQFELAREREPTPALVTSEMIARSFANAKFKAADALERRQRESLGPVGEG